jgi:tetratricopeptide (TPR) repeat protein
MPRNSYPGLLAVILMCYVLAPIYNAGQTSSRAENQLQALFSRAQAAQSVRAYATAARDYEDILKLRPGIPEIQANLGLMDHLLGNYRQAVQNFEAALRQKPGLFAPNLFLGADLLHLRRPTQAIPYLQKADQLDPNNLQVKLALARAYADADNFDKANENYYLAARIAPGNLDAGFGLGITYMRLQQSAAERLASVAGKSIYAKILLAESLVHEAGFGQEDSLAKNAEARDSLRIYQQLFVSHPRFDGLHTAMGFDEIRLGKSAQARADFNAEIATSPHFLPAWLGLAELDLQSAESADGQKVLEKIWGTDGNFLRVHLPLMCAGADPQTADTVQREIRTISDSTSDPGLKKLLGDTVCSERGFVPANQKDTATMNGRGNPMSMLRLPSTSTPSELDAEGRYTACARKLQAETRRPDLSDLNLLARCSYRIGDYRGAFVAAGNALQVGGSEPEALYWRAKSSMKLSLEALLATGNAHPNSYQAHLLLGQTYLTMNRFREAEAEYHKALARSPGTLAAQMGLGIANWKAGNSDEALVYVKKVLAENPKDPQASYIAGEILVQRHAYAQARPYLLTAVAGTDKTALYAHALLSKADAAQGKMNDAVAQLKQSLNADDDGSLHFQLYQLYRRLGERQAASIALRESEIIRSRQAQKSEALIEIPH